MENKREPVSQPKDSRNDFLAKMLCVISAVVYMSTRLTGVLNFLIEYRLRFPNKVKPSGSEVPLAFELAGLEAQSRAAFVKSVLPKLQKLGLIEQHTTGFALLGNYQQRLTEMLQQTDCIPDSVYITQKGIAKSAIQQQVAIKDIADCALKFHTELTRSDNLKIVNAHLMSLENFSCLQDEKVIRLINNVDILLIALLTESKFRYQNFHIGQEQLVIAARHLKFKCNKKKLNSVKKTLYEHEDTRKLFTNNEAAKYNCRLVDNFLDIIQVQSNKTIEINGQQCNLYQLATAIKDSISKTVVTEVGEGSTATMANGNLFSQYEPLTIPSQFGYSQQSNDIQHSPFFPTSAANA